MPVLKPLVYMAKVPHWSEKTLLRVDILLKQLVMGHKLSMPISRPMPSIGPRCHELRVKDYKVTWRIIYRVDKDVIVIVEIFKKKSIKTPKHIVNECKNRLARYDQ